MAESLRRGVDPCDAAELSGEGVAGQVHVEAVGDPAADEACVLQLAVPPAMDGLRTRALLRVRADGEQLLTFCPATVIDLLRRVEQEVVRLRRAANVGEIGAEEEAKLDEHRAAKGKDPFLATLAVYAERAAVGVEVANQNTGQLASADAEEEQAEERETVARMLGDRDEPRSRVGW